MENNEQRIYSTEFLSRLFKLLDDYDDHDLFWRCGEMYGGGLHAAPASFFVNCNDLFWWGCADLEEITPENIDVLEKAYADSDAACKFGRIYATDVFAARMRNMRPQHACYPKDHPEIWPLYDAAGPERAVEFGNPHKHP